jgi:hypothetical protein
MFSNFSESPKAIEESQKAAEENQKATEESGNPLKKMESH